MIPCRLTSSFLAAALVWTLSSKDLHSLHSPQFPHCSHFPILQPPASKLFPPLSPYFHVPYFLYKVFSSLYLRTSPIVFQGLPSTRRGSSVILSQSRLIQWVVICCWFISIPTTSVDVVSSNANLEAENGCGCGKLLGRGKVSVWEADRMKMSTRQPMVDQAQKPG